MKTLIYIIPKNEKNYISKVEISWIKHALKLSASGKQNNSVFL